MNDEERLIGALWGLFAPEIASGHPVYFSFSADSVKEALQKARIAADSALRVICDAARQCFDISGRNVTLRPNALTSKECGRSMAIVLVCQQVLAVETMIDDGQVSRNAYFPRLRELMSGDLPRARQCPFSRNDFSRIWRTFKQEIQSCSGSTSDTATFQFGRYKGSNATRGFPFSQALLSRGDLIDLQKHAQHARLLSNRAWEAWREVRRVHRSLSRRAQKLILEGSLHQEILEQVRQFLQRTPASTAQTGKRTSLTNVLEFAIGVDPDDFFSEKFFAFVQRKDSSTPLHDDGMIIEKLSELLPGDTYILCSPSEGNDYWAFHEHDVEVTAGRSFIVVARGRGLERARAMLDDLTLPLQLAERRCSTLVQSTDIRACRVELPQDSKLTITIRAGRIVRNNTSAPSSVPYEWLGGVCVDFRSRKYLREALPDAVRFGAADFPLAALVGVGALNTSWVGFKKRLDALETDATLELLYPNGQTAQLCVAGLPRVAAERVGFLVNEDGTIAPRLQRLDERASALVGYYEPTVIASQLSIAELGALVRDIRDQNRSRYSGVDRQDLWNRVEASNAPAGLKSLIKAFLASCSPAEIAAKLRF